VQIVDDEVKNNVDVDDDQNVKKVGHGGVRRSDELDMLSLHTFGGKEIDGYNRLRL
jgi:hypothetical protein